MFSLTVRIAQLNGGQSTAGCLHPVAGVEHLNRTDHHLGHGHRAVDGRRQLQQLLRRRLITAVLFRRRTANAAGDLRGAVQHFGADDLETTVGRCAVGGVRNANRRCRAAAVHHRGGRRSVVAGGRREVDGNRLDAGQVLGQPIGGGGGGG